MTDNRIVLPVASLPGNMEHSLPTLHVPSSLRSPRGQTKTGWGCDVDEGKHRDFRWEVLGQ